MLHHMFPTSHHAQEPDGGLCKPLEKLLKPHSQHLIEGNCQSTVPHLTMGSRSV